LPRTPQRVIRPPTSPHAPWRLPAHPVGLRIMYIM
jgi:hypothetical protein